MIHAVNGIEPEIKENVFIAEGSKIIGDVFISSKASIWFNAIIRGDLSPIKIGKNTNIQENS
ncbi:MAG: gamma carbonic anhydrase family protein, partial [archaeon]